MCDSLRKSIANTKFVHSLFINMYGKEFQNKAACMPDNKQNKTLLNKQKRSTGASKSVRTNHHNKISHWQAKAHMQAESMVPRETMMMQMITNSVTINNNTLTVLISKT